jgi:hypothetical protein
MSGGSRVTTTESGPWGGYVGDPEFKGTQSWGQQPYLIGGMEQARSLYDMQGGMGPDYYGGPTVAGFSPEQQLAQRSTMGYATGPRPAAQQAAAEKAMIGGLGGQVDYNQFQPMADVYGQQYLSEIQKNMPAVRQSMVEYQPGGGSRGDIVQGQIAGAAGKNLAQNLAGLYGGAYSAAQERVPQFAQQYPTIMGAPLGMSQAMGDVGEQRRAMSQAGIDADVARYNYQQMAPYQALANYMGTVSGDYGGSSRMTQPGPSGLSQLGQIAGIASMFSDERLKENINKVGSFKGLDLYEFNYIWSPDKVIGFIAQEVEKVLPEAVIEVLGYKTVNYGKILGAT